MHGWDTRRKLTSRVANYIAHVLLAPGVSDLTGSFRLYRKDAMLDVIRRVRSRGWVPPITHGCFLQLSASLFGRLLTLTLFRLVAVVQPGVPSKASVGGLILGARKTVQTWWQL